MNLNKLREFMLAPVRPEWRTFAANGIVENCPSSLLAASSVLLDFPVRRSIRACPLLFIQIPKNAGTTISTQLYGGHSGHRTAQWYRKALGPSFEEKFKFAIFRDPFDRFCSAYRFLRDGGSDGVKASPDARRRVAEHSFPHFVASCAESGIEVLRTVDPVFHTQAEYIHDEDGQLMIDALFDLRAIQGRRFSVNGRTIQMDVARNRNASRRPLYSDAEEPELRRCVEGLYECDLALRALCRNPFIGDASERVASCDGGGRA